MDFEKRFRYEDVDREISIPITIRGNGDAVELTPKIDTGATYCIFQRQYLEMLGIELSTGDRISIRTATGSFIAFGHRLRIEIADWGLETLVYFAEPFEFPRNVLGRQGWMDQFQLGLIESRREIYLKKLS